MDEQFTNSFGRIVRIVASKEGAFLQIKDIHGKEIGSAALNGDELQRLFTLVNKATGITECL